MTDLLNLTILFAAAVGLVFLQIFLSKRESKWPGLVIPVILFLFSLLAPFNLMAPSDGVTAGFMLLMLIVFLLANIPTIVFAAIYRACREKLRKKSQLDKMNIQDL